MGQTREVEVFRYVAADTIEERMVQLQVGHHCGLAWVCDCAMPAHALCRPTSPSTS